MTTPTLKRFDLSWLGKESPVILRATIVVDGVEVEVTDKAGAEMAETWKAFVQERIRQVLINFV